METTNEETDEQLKLTSRPSANRIIRLPSGQMTWSTWERTFSHVRSGVRRLFCSAQIENERGSRQRIQFGERTTSISVLEWPMLQTMAPFFILSMCSRVTTFLLPVAVISRSTLRITSLSFSTRKPSMLRRNGPKEFFKKNRTKVKGKKRNLPGLKGTNGIDFSDVNDGTECFKGLTAALADFTVSANDDLLTAKHHVRRPFQTAIRSIHKSVLLENRSAFRKFRNIFLSCTEGNS